MKMKKHTLLQIFILALFLACSKNEPKSFEYWDDLANKKRSEITALTQSIPCSNIEEFGIVSTGGNYYPVHLSIIEKFARIKLELEDILREREIAGSREGFAWAREESLLPNPPVRKVCQNSKPLLIYSHDLSLEEVNLELPIWYEEIKTFYENVSCNDANQWTGRYILSQNCSIEAFAVHKTVGKEEMDNKLDVYNMLMVRKMSLEKTKCESGFPAEKLVKNQPVICEAGKPVVIEN